MNLKNPLKGTPFFIRRTFLNVFSIKSGTDKNATIEGIKKDIAFRGPATWILMFSILIASIGLNVNSIAVIIGAMLISPLMGPILGVGLSLGINDWSMLFRSLKNLGIATLVGLITSSVYFALTPLDFAQSELLSRTRPTILDVMVALFGGFAGIIAGSRKEKSNVVPGVAIATALMPPLCTAGYGLANMNMAFFMGAFYLFFINSVFIALSTYLVVRYLKFPKVGEMGARMEKRYKIGLTVFLVITILPSIIIFWRVIQETRYVLNAEKFVMENCNFPGSELISKKIAYDKEESTIDLYYIGSRINKEKEQNLISLLDEYELSGDDFLPTTKKTRLIVHQDNDESQNIEKKFENMNEQLKLSILEDIYTKNQAIILDKDEKIQLLEDQLFRLKSMSMVPMDQLKKELDFHYDKVEKFSFANVIEVSGDNNLSLDTIPSLLIRFKSGVRNNAKEKELESINDWLKIRFGKEKIQVIEY